MREIKFRALKDDISDCKFVYGCLVYDAIGTPRITEKSSSGDGLLFHTCLKATEGQYAGLKDKNGKEIYEGDILQEQEGCRNKFIIVPMCGGLSVHNLRNYGQQNNELIAYPTNDVQTASWIEQQEVVGNIHKNPELLK